MGSDGNSVLKSLSILKHDGGGCYPGWRGEEGGGGGCAVYEDCEYIEPPTGGGNSTNTSTKNACDGISKDNKNTRLKDRLIGLQNLVKTSSTEEGFQVVRNPSNSGDQILAPESKNHKEVSFSDKEYAIGYAHTHRNVDNVKGIFSLKDLQTFWSMVNRNNDLINQGKVNYNLYDLFSILILQDGMYMLRIYDANVVKNSSNQSKRDNYK